MEDLIERYEAELNAIRESQLKNKLSGSAYLVDKRQAQADMLERVIKDLKNL